MRKVVETWYRKIFPKRVPKYQTYRPFFLERTGLEIGGPSPIFQNSGFLPVYNWLQQLDNCTFSNETVWEGRLEAGKSFRYSPGKSGYQFFSEGNDLQFAQDNTYDCVLSSHNIEHYANPIKALREWKRVVKKGGILLLVVPHKDNTFDHARPLTTIEHLILDADTNMQENDTTHFEEVIQLHDLKKDPAGISQEELKERTLNNIQNRCVHHHVFNTPLVVKALDEAGWTIRKINWMNPYHIIVLAQNIGNKPNNTNWLLPKAFSESPFPSDK
ncbi:MAG: class I SAM-dependent methyltransferase [Hydrotalea sp.]|nr:class I SAM-dependent methyltransferase [Hydrotalea sp.]